MNYRFLFISLLLVCASQITFANPTDSLRTETIEGKRYIIHRVESKETLYSISRKYKVKVNDIRNANNGLENGIQIFQEIKIPIFSKDKPVLPKPIEEAKRFHVVEKGETLYSISRRYQIPIDSIKDINNLDSNTLSLGDSLIISIQKMTSVDTTSTETAEDKIHIVSASETLYSISKKYEISVDDLKRLNNLASNEIDIGQKLTISIVDLKNDVDSLSQQAVVADSLSKKVVVADTTAKVDSIKLKAKEAIPVVDTIFVKSDTSRFKTRTERMGNVEKTVEQGFAMKIDGKPQTRKFLALHRYAPVGTVLEVKNEMNNRSIFARVVGKLPETGVNKSVLIRISNSAYKKLGGIDSKIPVQVGYVLE